jgi:hypothetical protein
MKKIITSFACMFIGLLAGAQMSRSPLAMQYAGLGTYSNKFMDIFSCTNNQAALSRLTSVQAGFFSERRSREIALHKAVAGMPLRMGGLALAAAYSGYKLYNETQAAIAYGRALGEKFDLGVQFNYNIIRIPGYGNASAIGFEIGSMFHLAEKLTTGLHVSNPVGGKYGKNRNEKLPMVITMGWGYEVSDKLFITTELGKTRGQVFNMNFGLQYNFAEQLFIRTGLATGYDHSFAGIGLKWNNFRTDVAISWHPQLGFSPSFIMIICLKNKS